MADPKPEKDFKGILDEELPNVNELANSDLSAAIEKLNALEKQTRQASDSISTGRILIHICRLCWDKKEYKLLCEQISLLSKKHGQLKAAITKMVQDVMSLLEESPDKATKLEIIDTLRIVTEGKLYVEVERARLTRLLSQIKEEEGDMSAAQTILTELQVETYGSMDKREKTEFILEQVRLTLARSDYQLAAILARKIGTKYFEDEDAGDLKLRYYELMIRIGLENDAYLDICKYYYAVLSTKGVSDDPEKWHDILSNVVYFIVLSPHDNEQSDLLHRVAADARLLELPLHRELIRCFTNQELMRWPRIEEIYGQHLRSTPVFAPHDTKADNRYMKLKDRVIDHNIRVVAKYYSRITLSRLQILLDLDAERTQTHLSGLVSNRSVYARIDRPAGLVTFGEPKGAGTVLEEWSYDIGKLLGSIETVRQMITKEEMMVSIAA